MRTNEKCFVCFMGKATICYLIEWSVPEDILARLFTACICFRMCDRERSLECCQKKKQIFTVQNYMLMLLFNIHDEYMDMGALKTRTLWWRGNKLKGINSKTDTDEKAKTTKMKKSEAIHWQNNRGIMTLVLN